MRPPRRTSQLRVAYLVAAVCRPPAHPPRHPRRVFPRLARIRVLAHKRDRRQRRRRQSQRRMQQRPRLTPAPRLLPPNLHRHQRERELVNSVFLRALSHPNAHAFEFRSITTIITRFIGSLRFSPFWVALFRFRYGHAPYAISPSSSKRIAPDTPQPNSDHPNSQSPLLPTSVLVDVRPNV